MTLDFNECMVIAPLHARIRSAQLCWIFASQGLRNMMKCLVSWSLSRYPCFLHYWQLLKWYARKVACFRGTTSILGNSVTTTHHNSCDQHSTLDHHRHNTVKNEYVRLMSVSSTDPFKSIIQNQDFWKGSGSRYSADWLVTSAWRRCA